MSVIEFITFDFDANVLKELLYSFVMPFGFDQVFYQRHKIYKAYGDMVSRKFMHVNLVTGLMSFLVFCLLQINFAFYVEYDGGKYFLLLFLYATIGVFIGLMFIVFNKNRKQ